MMKCKSCKKSIDDDSIYCKYCGTCQHRTKREKKSELIVPKARKLASGQYFIQLRLNGESISITKPTEREAIAEARAIKSGVIEKKKSKPAGITVEQAMKDYIEKNTAILSPATIRAYNAYLSARYKSIKNKPIDADIDWQAVINEEAADCSPKYVRNLWAFIVVSLGAQGVKLPDINLPRKTKNELPWLTYPQILKFMDAIRDTDVELAALLALHGLRQSEIMGLTADKIVDGNIIIHGAAVRGETGLVYKETNKNVSSQRVVPIMIDRLSELLKDKEGILIDYAALTMTKRINAICEKAGLPIVGAHGLRRSFASLCQHLNISERTCMSLGGWSDYSTMHAAYIKLDKADIINDANIISGALNVQNANENANR